jgi:hypothetical protein
MPGLLELQRRIMHAVLGGDAAGAAACIAPQAPARQVPAPRGLAPRGLAPRGLALHGLAPPSIAPAQRLDIYAATARTNFIESLISSYPAVRRLVGADYFAQCARGFHRRHPSVSGDLQPAGIGFAQYLMELHGADDYRYLGDVARLEWLIQEALLAAAHPPFDLAKLGAVAPEAYDGLRFRLHPTVRLFDSPYPCVHIWQANVESDAEPELIDLSEGGDRVLLLRSHDGRLTFHRLSRGERKFLHALSAGERFDAAVAAGGSEDGDTRHASDDDSAFCGDGEIDAAAALQRFVLCGVIVDFR